MLISEKSRSPAKWRRSVGVRDDRERAAQPGHVERLAGRHQRDGSARHFGIERRDGHVAVAFEDEVAVDLVRADEDVAAEADGREALEIGAAEHAADRVVRVAEDEDARAVGDGGLESVEVDLPAAIGTHGERRFLVDRSVVLRRAEDGRVDGRLDEHAILRRRGHAAHLLESHEHPGLKDDGVRIDLPAVEAREAIDDHLPQFGRLVAVAEHAVLDARAQGGHDRLRHAEVHVGGPEREHVRAVDVPLGAVGMQAVDGLVEVGGHEAHRTPVWSMLLANGAYRRQPRQAVTCMYQEFFGLDRPPFHITPDPEFLFLSPSHEEALASIVYGIEQRKGFIVVLGDVGLGKTTILRYYLDELAPEESDDGLRLQPES